jgi:hypothetical protein
MSKPPGRPNAGKIGRGNADNAPAIADPLGFYPARPNQIVNRSLRDAEMLSGLVDRQGITLKCIEALGKDSLSDG